MWNLINNAISTVYSWDTAMLLAVIFFIVALVFRMKLKDALKAALLVGIGYTGLQLVINYMSEVMTPATEYYSAMGTGFTITDMPWTAVGALQYLAPWCFICIPLMCLLSVVLVRCKVFKTIHLDIWGYGQFFLAGSFALVLFHSYILGIVVTFACFFVCLFLADHTAKRWSESLSMPGTTNSCLSWLGLGNSVCWVVNKIIDCIPKVRDINWDPKWMQSKLGIFGETSVMGATLGLILGLLTRQGVNGVLSMAMGIAAVMVLLPHVLKVFMEGIGMITSAATTWAMKHIGSDREVYFAVDIAMSAGTPVAITVATIMYPITILLAFAIPGIRYFPIGMMTMIIYMAGWCAMFCKQNFFRALICAVFLMAVMMIFTQFTSAAATSVCEYFNVEVGGQVASVAFADWPYVIMTFIQRLIGG